MAADIDRRALLDDVPLQIRRNLRPEEHSTHEMVDSAIDNETMETTDHELYALFTQETDLVNEGLLGELTGYWVLSSVQEAEDLLRHIFWTNRNEAEEGESSGKSSTASPPQKKGSNEINPKRLSPKLQEDFREANIKEWRAITDSKAVRIIPPSQAMTVRTISRQNHVLSHGPAAQTAGGSWSRAAPQESLVRPRISGPRLSGSTSLRAHATDRITDGHTTDHCRSGMVVRGCRC